VPCFTRCRLHPRPSPGQRPIWWYMARMADRAGRHKAQGPERTLRHVHPAMPGSASRRGVGKDWLLEPGVAMVHITGAG
jgi:hypothetical protein